MSNLSPPVSRVTRWRVEVLVTEPDGARSWWLCDTYKTEQHAARAAAATAIATGRQHRVVAVEG